MAFVQCSRVSLAFAGRDILKDAGLHLSAGSRACLTGVNGSGKSTLMKVLAGKIPADSGDRIIQKGTRVSYLPQSGIAHRGKSLREEAETAFDSIRDMTNRMDEIGRVLETAKDDNSRTAGLLDEYHQLQEAVEDSGYYRREAAVAAVLSGLGFSQDDLNRDTGEFSGGWQMRIALSKILLERPDILLLDEPTNYLDIEARTWLETWLKNFPGGCLLVSHDRYFLDLTVNEVYELFQGRLKRYAGNYSAYEKVRDQELENLRKRYAEQQEEIARAEDLIRRFRYKASKAAMVQDRIKKLEKMERIEIPESLKKINITLPPPPHAGRIALSLSGIGKNYGGRQVLSGLDLVLESRERLLVVGRNGAGKSTLLRIIAGRDHEFEGTVHYGAGIIPGFFSQDEGMLLNNANGVNDANDAAVNPPPGGKGPEETAEAIDGNQTVLELLEAEAPTALIPRIRDMLGAFLFRGDDVYKPVSVLSGGEKSRLALLKILLRPINLLILDEPTNHLDLHSKDILLDALKAFSGAIIFVSHDRAFMEALSTKTLELSPRRLEAGSPGPAVHRLFYGDYGYYLNRLEQENAEAPGPEAGPASGGDRAAGNKPGDGNRDTVPAAPAPADPPSPADIPAEKNAAASGPNPPVILIKAGREQPLSAGERREQEKQKQTLARRLRRQEEEVLRALENLEAEKTRLEAELARPEVYRNGDKARSVQSRLEVLAGEIKTKTGDWENLAGELERI
ncbi:MAG: ABC-F family ATP-binding cassette domain-containing protein [Treponema sp.]|jgi:ATP-binding cassette subfamily F protein 3|nr:ABC-F family ATP-binding cassette domain-containing protein [Treponema sp.]